MENKFVLSRMRKTFLDHVGMSHELYTAVEEFIEEPSQAGMEVLASKLKGFEFTSNILKDTIKSGTKDASEAIDE